LARVERQELFAGRLDLLALTLDTAVQPRFFRQVRQAFPDLEYYDADVPVSVQYAARFDWFPTLPGRALVDEAGNALEVEPLASRWTVERPLPPLRTLTLAPDGDPALAEPRHLLVGCDGQTLRYPLDNPRLLLIGLQALLRRHDPDLILSQWGDTWLFPALRRWARASGVPFHPSRDPYRAWQVKPAGSTFTYGLVLYRGEQTYLFGRWHIDTANAPMFQECALAGVLEQTAVSGMPVQAMARRSPGAGITAMQMISALRREVLVPVTKQQAERYKSARALLRADRGGLVFQPQVGLHSDVVELDFISMYPAIITLFNISPETVGQGGGETAVAPELNLPIDQSRPGLLPETLAPLLRQRRAIKSLLAGLTRQDCRRPALAARAAALKWLLVVAFGYAGYKRARFGRIEAHEAITAYSREALLRAKETAESLGYTVLHLYVDGLWVQRPGVTTAVAAQPLLAAIEAATGLPIALEGVYRWIAFLPSKQDGRVPVPNRYFGVFADGAIKARGIELRRHDTPPFVAGVQGALLACLARRVRDGETAVSHECREALVALLNGRLAALRQGAVAPADLLLAQRLSRAVGDYAAPSAAARAAAQLQAAGKARQPGQRIQFILTRGEPGVYAWGLPQPLDPRCIDLARYETLTLRAAQTVLQPWGVTLAELGDWLAEGWRQGRLGL
jgi:DNA polymerase II